MYLEREPKWRRPSRNPRTSRDSRVPTKRTKERRYLLFVCLTCFRLTSHLNWGHGNNDFLPFARRNLLGRSKPSMYVLYLRYGNIMHSRFHFDGKCFTICIWVMDQAMPDWQVWVIVLLLLCSNKCSWFIKARHLYLLPLIDDGKHPLSLRIGALWKSFPWLIWGRRPQVHAHRIARMFFSSKPSILKN